MTQLFTGTGLGLHGSSLSQLGGYGPKGAASLGQGGESVYVNGANGNLVLKQSDGFLSDIGLGLDLFQIYNSRGEGGGSWCFSIDSHLQFEGAPNTVGSIVKRIDEDGHCSRFIYNERQLTYLAEDGTTTRLAFQNGGWQYLEGTGQSSCHYNAQGQLTSLRNRDGHEFRFSYQNGQLASITDSFKKQTVTWSFSQGLLRDVTWTSEDKTVHHLHYDYDAHHRLSKVSRDLGNGKTYWITYNYAGDSNLISDIFQSDGTKLHIDYDAEGRVTRLIDGEGRTSSYQYLDGKTIVTNGLGETWVYSYDADARLTGIDGPENYHIRYYYEGKHLVGITQGNQHWQFAYNEAGDCIRIVAPSGQVTLRTYDSEHRLLSETRYQTFDGEHHPQKPLTTHFIYDELGHLRFEISTDGTVTEHRYDRDGLRISSRCYLRGLLNVTTEQVLTLSDLINWGQHQDQQAISLADYHYDWRGNLLEEIHYLQVNEKGEGVLTNDALRTYSRYDAAGLLVEKSSLTANGLSTTHYFYDDLGRLIKTTDNQHHEQTIEYDDAHQCIIKTDPNGLQTIYTYDQSGLLLSTQRLDSAHQYGIITYHYDAAGRLIAETHLDGKTSYSFYDQQGRLQATLSGSGHVTEYLYDDEGHCIQTYQYQQMIDISNGRGRYSDIKPKTNAQDRISQVVYNAYNQIAYQIDAAGAVIGYQYDAEGHVIAKTAYANRLKNFLSTTRLLISDMALIVSSDDRTMSYYYDAEGRLQGEVNGEGAATEYRYDKTGHLIERCRYANKVMLPLTGDWRVDAPMSINNKDIHNYSIYNIAGLKVADIDAGGYLTEYCYDAEGLLTDTIAYYTRINSSTSPNENTTLELIRPSINSNDHRTGYRYNDLNQLVEEKTQSGLVITYTYNKQGLVISKTSTDSKTHEARKQQYRYDALGRVIQALDALGAAALEKNNLYSNDQIEHIWQQHSDHYVYDNAGHLLSKTNALNQMSRYFYNDAGLLVYTLSPTGAVTETRYNAFNQVETTIRYSAYWVGGAEANTQQLKQYFMSFADKRFDEVTHYEYNTLGFVISKCQGSGGQFSTTYNVFGEVEQTSQRTGLNHETLTHFQYDRRGLLRYRVEDAGAINKTFEAQYDAFGRVENTLDGLHGATIYWLNKRGEQINIYTPGKGSKSRTYDAFGRVLSIEDDKTDGSYIYDDKNNTLTLNHSVDDSSIVTQFNAFGDKIMITDGNHQQTSYQYDAKGELIHIDSPEHTSNDYSYDNNGHLLFQKDAGGHIIRYTYDAEGRVLTKAVDPDGLNLTTTYTYDGIGRQLQVIDHGRCTRFTYDNQGNLIKKCVDPDGLNLITEFNYTESGLIARQTIYNTQGINKVIAYEWDALGRCLATTIDPDGLKLTTRYEYDNNDNLVAQTDANQHRTQYMYAVDRRLRYRIDARGIVTEHCYDAKGHEIQTIIYANRVPTATHYNEKSLMTAVQPDDNADHYQFFAYDKQGHLINSYDGLGYATRYTYDANDNVITKSLSVIPCSLSLLKSGSRPSGVSSNSDRVTHFTYNGLNQECYQTDPNGQVTEYRYDTAGQLIKKTRFANSPSIKDMGNDYSLSKFQEKMQANIDKDESTQYAYDMAGRLQIQANPSGVIIAYQYDEAGNVIATTQYATKLTAQQLASDQWVKQIVSSNNDRMTRAVYDTAGREIYRISAMGKILERRYDAVGNVITEIAHAKSVLGQDNVLDHLTRYQYDIAGRLLKKTDANLQSTQFTYDNNNNLTTKKAANNACWTYHYDETNQLIETLSPKTTFSTSKNEETRSIITRNQYDSFGNLITIIRDATGINQTVYYTYDTKNQKISTIYPDRAVNRSTQITNKERQEEIKTLSETYTYNAFGELVASRDRAGNWRHWVYDNAGHMIYAVDTEKSLTQYLYDAFDNVSRKTMYANHLQISGEYSEKLITDAISFSNNDRHEEYSYDQDNHMTESRKDAVNLYNSRSGKYYVLSPTTRLAYNAFGEVVKRSVQLTESDWAITKSYYNTEGLKTAGIDAEGYLTTYQYNDFDQLESEIQYALRTKNATDDQYTIPNTNIKDRQVTFLYDAIGQLTTKILKKVSYEQLVGNGPQYKTVSSDLISRYRYDALGNLVSTTDAQGNTAYSYYNESGQLTAKVGANVKAGRSATTYRYDALGQLVESRQWAGGAKEADEANFTLKGASVGDVIMSDVYDKDGQLMMQVDGTGHMVNYSYDANGNIARSWQVVNRADKSIVLQDKRYSYDAENRLIQTAILKSNGQYATDDAKYNAFGELVAKGINGLFSEQIDYDKAGRVWRSNMQGYFQIYVYDLSDHVTQVVTSTNAYGTEYENNGVDLSESTYETAIRYDQDNWRYDLQRQDTVYDALGRMLSQIKDGSTSASDKFNKKIIKKAIQLQQVDRWGNVISHTNANQYTTHYEYNAFDQILQQDLPEVNVVDEHGVTRRLRPVINYAYDALGRAIAMTDANHHTVAKIIDAEGRITKEIDALGHHRDKDYNLLGQLVAATNERGGDTTYTYDKANRLLSVTTAQTSQRYEYDGAGQLIKQTIGRDSETIYGYDAQGNQITRAQAGFVTTYEYDDAGHKIIERDAKNNTLSWTYDKKGRLQEHTDLGGHRTTYTYNKNGLLLTEQSTHGKNMKYHYFSDGQLAKYEDMARNEFVDYTYDAEGNVLSKESSRVGAWAVEKDQYQYDELGRLAQVRRRGSEDTDSRIPDKDHALLSIDYEYDAVGNIRDTKVDANYTGYQHVTHEDYFLYDANNRMILNKGQLQNGQILITKNQGSELGYDETGNINSADQYKNGELEHYTYRYNLANQLERIRKNNIDLQTKRYDDAGHVVEENLYNQLGVLTQKNLMSYRSGRLTDQLTNDENGNEVNRTHYDYDNAGNLEKLTTKADSHGTTAGYVQTHKYSYELWEGYQQKTDMATLDVAKHDTTYGKSERIYDVNGQLTEARDSQVGYQSQNNTTRYLASSIDGIRAREDKDGQTNYLMVAGKTIGDLRLDNNKTQHLEVYSGFTPIGILEQPGRMTGFLNTDQKLNPKKQSDFLNRDVSQEAISPPEAPQDNLGSYTLQAGDTLESIALQVYGDSSLWYLLADANGITDRQAHAGEKGSQLHAGQSLNIPPTAGNQHHTNSTHKVLNSNDMIGNTSATTPLPPTPPPPRNHNGFRSIMATISIAIIAVVATVMSAGALALIATGGLASLGAAGLGGVINGLMTAGTAVLGGASALSTPTLLGAGLSAGFIGSLAAQTAANALGQQKGIDYRGALISGLATAATAGASRLLSAVNAYKDITNAINLPPIQAFNIQTATEMMGKDALTQSINLSLRDHQHFDWLELGINATTAGLIGGRYGKELTETLKPLDHNTGILSSELQSLTTGATTSAATGNHFNAGQVLTDNLGGAIGSSMVQAGMNLDSAAWKDDVYDGLVYDSELLGDGGWGWQFIHDAIGGVDEMGLVVSGMVEPMYQAIKVKFSNTTDGNIVRGRLSMKYETGMEAGQYLLSAGVVSTGKSDEGGISYGSYQLASSKNQVQEFLRYEGRSWASEFDGLDPTQPGTFGDKWKAIAKTQGEDFFNAQHAYINRTHYTPVRKYLQKYTGLDVNTQPAAVQDAVWSASVQHGKAKYFLVDAINSISGLERSSLEFAPAFLNAIYDKRAAYVSSLNIAGKDKLLQRRYPDERHRALDMLKKSRL